MMSYNSLIVIDIENLINTTLENDKLSEDESESSIPDQELKKKKGSNDMKRDLLKKKTSTNANNYSIKSFNSSSRQNK